MTSVRNILIALSTVTVLAAPVAALAQSFGDFPPAPSEFPTPSAPVTKGVSK